MKAYTRPLAGALACVSLCLTAFATTSTQLSEQDVFKAFNQAIESKDWKAALKAADDEATLGPAGWTNARRMRLTVFMRSQDDKGAQSVINDISGDLGAVGKAHFNALSAANSAAVVKSFSGYQALLEKQLLDSKILRLQLYIKANDVSGFTEYVRALVEADKDNAAVLNAVAWQIAGPNPETDVKGGSMPNYFGMTKRPVEFLSKNLLETAKKASDKAVKMTNRQNGGFMDTLAWTQYRLGDKTGAAKTELEASKHKDVPKELYEYVSLWFTGNVNKGKA